MPNYVKVVPSIAIAFVSYEQVCWVSSILMFLQLTVAHHKTATKLAASFEHHLSQVCLSTHKCVDILYLAP